MDNEVYSFALKNTLNEIQNICPDIKNAFMFREDGEIIAGDKNTPEENIVHAIDAFDGVTEKAEAIGGVESIILEGNKNRISVSRMNELYLVTVTSRKADMNYVNTVTRVLVPTILKLLDKINPAPLKSAPPKLEVEPQIPIAKHVEKQLEEPIEEPRMEERKEQKEPEVKPEPVLPEPLVNQFIVENIGGLLVPTDTVRIDNDLLLQWQELYQDRKIEEVEIETFGGKSIRSKIKPIKDSKYEGKGIIQMPEKIQSTLEIKKGELVRVKPVIE